MGDARICVDRTRRLAGLAPAMGRKLNEPSIFNAVFGYTPIILMLIGLMGLSFLIFYLSEVRI